MPVTCTTQRGLTPALDLGDTFMRTLTLLTVILLTSCSLGVQNARYAPTSSTLTDVDSGIVLGSIESPAGITLLNLGTKEEIQYFGASVFCLRLPTGDYALKSIGTPYGKVTAVEPFVFSVAPGQRHYVGAVVDLWSSDEKRYAENRKGPYEKRYYDMSLLIGKGYEYSLFNRFGNLGPQFNKDCPSLKKDDFSISLMK